MVTYAYFEEIQSARRCEYGANNITIYHSNMIKRVKVDESSDKLQTVQLKLQLGVGKERKTKVFSKGTKINNMILYWSGEVFGQVIIMVAAVILLDLFLH